MFNCLEKRQEKRKYMGSKFCNCRLHVYAQIFSKLIKSVISWEVSSTWKQPKVQFVLNLFYSGPYSYTRATIEITFKKDCIKGTSLTYTPLGICHFVLKDICSQWMVWLASLGFVDYLYMFRLSWYLRKTTYQDKFWTK